MKMKRQLLILCEASATLRTEQELCDMFDGGVRVAVIGTNEWPNDEYVYFIEVTAPYDMDDPAEWTWGADWTVLMQGGVDVDYEDDDGRPGASSER